MLRSSPQTRSAITPQSLLLLTTLSLMVRIGLGPWGYSPSPNFGSVAQRYVVIDLGTNFFPVAINSSGVIAGNDATGLAQVWNQGTQTTLAACPHGLGNATAINSSGEIAGSGKFTYLEVVDGVTNSAIETHACSWSPPYTAVTDLDTQQGDPNSDHNHWEFVEHDAYASFAWAVSDSGTVYGYLTFQSADQPAIFSTSAPVASNPRTSWDPQGTYDVGSGNGGQILGAGGTNWCGEYNLTGSNPAWTNGCIVDNAIIPVPDPYPNGSTLIARAINTNGVAVGCLTNQAIFIQGGAITNLGTGYAEAINNYATVSTNTPPVTNNAPQIVGVDSTSTDAILWDQTYYDGTPTTNSVYVAKSLTAMIQQPSDSSPPAGVWTITSAVGINDSGCIVGTAVLNPAPDTPSGPVLLHGVLLVPASITRDGLPINSTNNTVVVGQQINLTNIVTGIPANAITSYLWNIPGATNGTAFKDYEPETNAPYACNYTNLAPADLTNSYCNFYWSSGGTNVVTCTTTIYGQTNTISATLNVSRPHAMIFATNGTIATGYDPNYNVFQTYLHFGDPPTNYPPPIPVPGMYFTETNSPASGGFTGSFQWVQLITNATLIRTTSTSTNTITFGAGLDTTYPYGFSDIDPIGTSDSPGLALYTTNNYGYESFDATMYLTWQANTNSTGGDKTVPVPLRGYQWNWSGTVTNASPTTNDGTGWSIKSTTYPTTNAPDFDVTNEPAWTNVD